MNQTQSALSTILVSLLLLFPVSGRADDNGVAVDLSQYGNRATLPDFTAAPCPDNPRALEQVRGNLYRHTTGPGLAVHSGFVLITNEGALVIDPAMTCTATWLRDEIKRRFGIGVRYVVDVHSDVADGRLRVEIGHRMSDRV